MFSWEQNHTNMKTSSLPVIAFLAAITAVALLPVSVAAATLAFTVTGLLPLVLADYGAAPRPRPARAPVVAFAPGAEAAVDRAA